MRPLRAAAYGSWPTAFAGFWTGAIEFRICNDKEVAPEPSTSMLTNPTKTTILATVTLSTLTCVGCVLNPRLASDEHNGPLGAAGAATPNSAGSAVAASPNSAGSAGVAAGPNTAGSAVAGSPDGCNFSGAGDPNGCSFGTAGSRPLPSAAVQCDGGGRFISVMPADGRINGVDISPDGQLVAIAAQTQGAMAGAPQPANVGVCHLDGSGCDLFGSHADIAYAVRFSPDGTLLASGGSDRDIAAKTWRVADGKLVRTFQTGASTQSVSGVLALAFSHDAKTLAVAGNLDVIQLWRECDATPVSKIALQDPNFLRGFPATPHAVFSRNDAFVLAAHESQTQSGALYRVSDGALLSTFEHGDEVFDAEFSPDETEVATVGNDGAFKLWDIGGSLKERVLVSNTIVSRIVWIDASRIATSDWAGAIKLWKRGSDGEFRYGCEWSAKGQTLDMALSSDGKKLVAAGQDGEGESSRNGVWVWDL